MNITEEVERFLLGLSGVYSSNLIFQFIMFYISEPNVVAEKIGYIIGYASAEVILVTTILWILALLGGRIFFGPIARNTSRALFFWSSVAATVILYLSNIPLIIRNSGNIVYWHGAILFIGPLFYGVGKFMGEKPE